MNNVLFKPIKIGRSSLAHRIVMAPLTRFKANDQHVHGDLALEYYDQRASTPGTLLIAEATFISPEAGGYDNVPGIYTSDQIAAWKRVSSGFYPKYLSHLKRTWYHLDHGRCACQKIFNIPPTVGIGTCCETWSPYTRRQLPIRLCLTETPQR